MEKQANNQRIMFLYPMPEFNGHVAYRINHSIWCAPWKTQSCERKLNDTTVCK